MQNILVPAIVLEFKKDSFPSKETGEIIHWSYIIAKIGDRMIKMPVVRDVEIPVDLNREIELKLEILATQNLTAKVRCIGFV